MGSCSSHEAMPSDVDAETFDFIRNADECARALERATRAMNPPLEVYEGILQVIAGFAGPSRELHAVLPCHSLTARGFAVVVVFVARRVAKFNQGPHLKYFDISNGGLTATRKRNSDWRETYVCASPSFNSGALWHC